MNGEEKDSTNDEGDGERAAVADTAEAGVEGAAEAQDDAGAGATGADEGQAGEGECSGAGSVAGDAMSMLNERTAQIVGHVSAIGTRLEGVANDFVSRFKSDDKLQTAFDRLYEEMTQYKDNFLFQAQKPLLLDLILLYDQISNQMDNLSENQEAVDGLDMVREQLLEVLYRRDVEPMEFDPEARFDREQMKAVKRVKTENQDEDKTIERLVRPGFAWNERVLRPQEVIVRRFSQG